MIKARGIAAIGAVIVFSLLIVWTVGGWSGFLSGGADVRSPKTAGAPGTVEIDEISEASGEVGPSPEDIRAWVSVEDLPEKIAVFRTVFWEPQDTTSLRVLIRTTPLVKGKTVLEIGTGSGLVALCCLQAGARKVVATDINPRAVANAEYNAGLLDLGERLDVRLVSETEPGAYVVVGEAEQFDVIISNPPWEDATPNTIGEYALYDDEFALMRSLLEGLSAHLKPEGKAFLAYGCVAAIKAIEQICAENDLAVEILDERELDSLPEVFLPGMLLSVTRKDRPKSPSE